MSMAADGNMSIKALTEDDIDQAFEKTRNKFKIPGVNLVLITEQYFEGGLKLFREHFLPHEPLCTAVGLEWSEVVETFIINVFKQHLSLMFVDEKSGEPIAFRATGIISRDDNEETPKSPIQSSFQDIMQYLHHCDAQAQFFDHFGIKEAFRFVALVVADKYKRRGLAKQIFNAAIDMIRNFGFERVYIRGEGTSNFSKKIYEKEGFEILYEKVHATWEVDGTHPFLNTGEHKSIKIYGRVVEQNK